MKVNNEFEFDTIAAVASGYSKSAISIIRVSGLDSIEKVNHIFKGKDLNKAKSHTLHYGYIKNIDETIIDQVLVSVYRAPRSFTKENMVEINTHGGLLVTKRVLERILLEDIRIAEPGEFTKRAFLNGRIDLIEAEAVMDLIEAKNDLAIKIAHKGLNKETTALIDSLKKRLLNLIVQIEVSIDYPEYDDILEVTNKEALIIVSDLLDETAQILKKSRQVRLIKEGINTVIIGSPNVGKSSILNMLIDEEKAIVTSIPGTTRDLVESTINIDGITLNLIDTAGIRKTEDAIEELGIKKTFKALEAADLVLLVLDISQKLNDYDKELLERTQDLNRIIIGNKSDLVSDSKSVEKNSFIYLSTLTKEGLANLKEAIITIFQLKDLRENDFNMLSNTRQIAHLENAKKAFISAKEAIKRQIPIDVLVIDLNIALEELSSILGTNYKEDLIAELFGRFCLGK